jgi:hypothetical protein
MIDRTTVVGRYRKRQAMSDENGIMHPEREPSQKKHVSCLHLRTFPD